MTSLVNQNSLIFVSPGSSIPFRILFRKRQLLKDMPLVFLMHFLTELSRRRWSTHILLSALFRPLWTKALRRCVYRILIDLRCYWRLLRTALATFLVVFKVNVIRRSWHDHCWWTCKIWRTFQNPREISGSNYFSRSTTQFIVRRIYSSFFPYGRCFAQMNFRLSHCPMLHLWFFFFLGWW